MKRMPLLLGAALIAGTLSLSPITPSNAAPALTSPSPTVSIGDDNIQPAATVVTKKKVIKKKGKKRVVTTTTTRKRFVYNSGRHGHRYKYKRGPYVYYYGGYYYSRPWWTLAAPGVGICIGC